MNRINKLFIVIFFSSCFLYPVHTQAQLSENNVTIDSVTYYYYVFEVADPQAVIFVLPSRSGDHEQWFPEGENSDIVQLAERYDFAIIAVDGIKSNWYSPGGGERIVLTIFDQALRTYSLSGLPIFVIGLSMGGTGAFTLVARNIHEYNFKGIYAAMGGTDLDDIPVFQEEIDSSWSGYTKFQAIKNADIYKDMIIILAHGKQDPSISYLHSYNMHKSLDQEEIENYYYETNDGHSVVPFLFIDEAFYHFDSFLDDLPDTVPEEDCCDVPPESGGVFFIQLLSPSTLYIPLLFVGVAIAGLIIYKKVKK